MAPTDGDGDISHPRMDVYEVSLQPSHFLEYPKNPKGSQNILQPLSGLQIVIGGFGNTISVIRRGMQGRTLGEAQVILFFSLVSF